MELYFNSLVRPHGMMLNYVEGFSSRLKMNYIIL